MLDSELSEHLGYEKHSNTGNSRNGKTLKTIKTDEGQIDLIIPRDRNSTFDPVVVKKYEKTLGPIENKIISMYAKGMTTRDIQSHVEEIYGLDISPTTISRITEAIESVFPGCEVQQYIIHQIRNTIRYVASKNQKEFMRDLKPVYKAPTEEAGYLALDKLEEKWGKSYPIKSWRKNWNNLAIYFKYPEQIRRVIYITNTVENLHRQFRKVTKNRVLFPNDDALTKMFYFAYRDITKKWTMSIRDWLSFSHNYPLYLRNG